VSLCTSLSHSPIDPFFLQCTFTCFSGWPFVSFSYDSVQLHSIFLLPRHGLYVCGPRFAKCDSTGCLQGRDSTLSRNERIDLAQSALNTVKPLFSSNDVNDPFSGTIPGGSYCFLLRTPRQLQSQDGHSTTRHKSYGRWHSRTMCRARRITRTSPNRLRRSREGIQPFKGTLYNLFH
jgi:hypothetical protein